MRLPSRALKALLVAHVVTSVGWLGAVVAFLSLALAAVATASPPTAQALYVAMDVLGTAALVPLSLASFATGLLQSLGSAWGLFRHWWVVVKLGISVLATAVLLMYVPTMRLLGDAAASASLTDDRGLLPSTSPVLHSAAAVLVLLLAAVLSVYKPRGLTRYGWRKQRAGRSAVAAA